MLRQPIAKRLLKNLLKSLPKLRIKKPKLQKPHPYHQKHQMLSLLIINLLPQLRQQMLLPNPMLLSLMRLLNPTLPIRKAKKRKRMLLSQTLNQLQQLLKVLPLLLLVEKNQKLLQKLQLKLQKPLLLVRRKLTMVAVKKQMITNQKELRNPMKRSLMIKSRTIRNRMTRNPMRRSQTMQKQVTHNQTAKKPMRKSLKALIRSLHPLNPPLRWVKVAPRQVAIVANLQ